MFQRYEVLRKGEIPIIRKDDNGRFVLYDDVSVRYKLLSKFIIPGDPKPKKNNSIPIIVRGKDYKKQYHHHVQPGWRIIILPSDIFTKYQKKALDYVPLVRTPYDQVNLRVLYYRETKRKIDLVNLLEATCDIMVKAKFIIDDNSTCVISTDGSRVFHDKKNPRAEIYVERMFIEEKQISLEI